MQKKWSLRRSSFLCLLALTLALSVLSGSVSLAAGADTGTATISKALPVFSLLYTDDGEIAREANGEITLPQISGWKAWTFEPTPSVRQFTANPGEKLYLKYNFTVYGNLHFTLNGWEGSIVPAIAEQSGAAVVPTEGNDAWMLTAGIYSGMVELEPGSIGATGHFGIVGAGAVIREMRVVSLDGDPADYPNDGLPEDTFDPMLEKVMYGDVDDNGQINAMDATHILLHTVSKKALTAKQQAAADANFDEEVNAMDATYVLLHTVGKMKITDPNAPPHGESFFDDFTDGIDSDRWYVIKQQWGAGNNGVLPENVNYTEDGVLVLTANGDLYEGTIGGVDGKRTGACVVTKDHLGPGSFEVKMKVLPRLGSCTAMWTYYNDGIRNHEIDIELPGNTDTFRYNLFTNWLTESDYESNNTTPDFYHNDGEWHTYRFDWHTDPQRIDFYIDGELEFSTTDKIPSVATNFWLGVWFPADWCGDPDFETAHMLVDWVKYTSYDDEDCEMSTNQLSTGVDQYPTAPIELPVNNYVANAGFDNDLFAWTQDGSVACTNGTAVLSGDSATLTQRISSVNAGGVYRITADASVAAAGDKAILLVEALGDDGETVIGSFAEALTFTDTDMSTKSKEITLPEGAYFIRLTLSGDDGACFDNLYVTQPSREDFTAE